MRSIQYLVAVTADGFIAGPDGEVGMFAMQGDHVDHYIATIREMDTVLMGRRTYEMGLAAGVTDPYPWMRTYVASRSMRASPDARVELVSDDVVGLARRLREEDGSPVYLCGGGVLAAQLLRAGLVDEVHLKVSPVVIGRGLPLFAELDAPVKLEPTSTRAFESGVALTKYLVTR